MRSAVRGLLPEGWERLERWMRIAGGTPKKSGLLSGESGEGGAERALSAPVTLPEHVTGVADGAWNAPRGAYVSKVTNNAKPLNSFWVSGGEV